MYKARTLILGVFLIALILGCALSIMVDSGYREKAVTINNHELNGLDTKIGGTVVIKYNTRHLNECIADMESRGYVVKQVEEKRTIGLNNTTIVVYERRK
jgi:lipoprotein